MKHSSLNVLFFIFRLRIVFDVKKLAIIGDVAGSIMKAS